MTTPKPSADQSAPGSLMIMIPGLIMIIIVAGFALVSMTGGEPTRGQTLDSSGFDALADSNDECVTCHRTASPGIIDQYGHSTMAATGVTCRSCHEVDALYPGSVEHEGTYVLASPTPAMCQNCHQNEVAQFNASRHAAPAYAAMWGTQQFTPEQLDMYEAIPEGSFDPDKSRNQIFDIEGPAITRFACQGCHNIGRPHEDGSIGECQQCHIRHEFSLEQARKPETCNACHIGPDHPQWEIYQESPHGISYMTMGHTWHWEADAGTLSTEDFPAPTCATCHMSGFGSAGTTHDVGERLTWYLFAPISQRRPGWEGNLARMQGVCRSCHNDVFVQDFYTDADLATLQVNEWVEESNAVMQYLKDNNLLTPAPFDEPVDFVFFDLWHHWGRTTKFGAWMQGPDYTQWHGAYELLREMADLKMTVNERLEAAGLEPVEFEPTSEFEDY